MVVYVVGYLNDEDGFDVIDIWSTEEQAKNRIEEIKEKRRKKKIIGYDYWIKNLTYTKCIVNKKDGIIWE